ncbi:hypothetical protein AOQ84DRAFT_390389 [Glonium stellatum]|uniref:Helicase C-terminal domain-containing protein n=1 Tax=Glonium stellatum TaxID=574774 RepID=A0A8E2EXG4_9PEZI|nr:hypothetical protein AOQ84DRAFT_390389 [Glonium stellatum]
MDCIQPQLTAPPWPLVGDLGHFQDSHSKEHDQDLSISSKESTSSYASVSATQPSTLATSACSAIKLEEELTLKDISNYISLGCLWFANVFEGYDSPRALDSERNWIEVLYPSLTEELQSALGVDATKLLHAGWIRMFLYRPQVSSTSNGSIFRIFLLPHDVGRRFIDRRSKALKAALQELLKRIDVSPETWSGCYVQGKEQIFDQWASAEEFSLFYLFNKLPSPDPSPENIRNRYTRRAVRELLDSVFSVASYASEPLRGLKTRLYPYQARSAALMIQREASPQLQLDPRLEARRSPDSQEFYYGARDGSFVQKPRYYESNRGGILSETMGLGKTVICLAVILATRFHLPQIPPEYQEPPPVRKNIGTLLSMAAATITRNAIPWQAYFKRYEEETGYCMERCKAELKKAVPRYFIPIELSRSSRTAIRGPPQKLIMCSGTIVVVPRNLLHQWQSEIKKHTEEGSLNVLVMDSKMMLPPATRLAKYDIILFSRNRFEQEIVDGADKHGRRPSRGPANQCNCPYIGATRVRDCSCLEEDEVYHSPLRDLHWLRIIIDEGHNFSSSNANAVLVAKQLRAERRWVVSGTPAKDLVGVEVDLSTADDTEGIDPGVMRELAVEQRKLFNPREDTTGAVKSLGALATHFLKVRPWCDSTAEGKSDWEDYFYRHEHHYRRTYSGFSACLKQTLEGMVVKTRPEDVERDIVLPLMVHRVVYLEPSFYDKMTANLFIQVLRANAITSERTDADYLFHKNNLKARHDLIKNLRQSNFTWSGFSWQDVCNTIKTSLSYLQKEDKNCSKRDYDMLAQSTQLVARVLDSPGWMALSKTHEVGLFVEEWPEDLTKSWALGATERPLMIGVTQLLIGQAHVDGQISAADPAEGLKLVGERARAQIEQLEDEGTKKKEDSQLAQETLAKTGVPSSCVAGEPVAGKRFSLSTGVKSSPKKSKKAPTTVKNEENTVVATTEATGIDTPVSPTRAKKRKLTLTDQLKELPEESPLRRVCVVGTTSSKLSYVIEKVMKHQEEEKILIFYDGDNTAYYIAQCLELLHVEHRIYARTLDNATRSKYVVAFNEDPTIRVLLIDVACGALGLNLNVASVVLIINPINRPSIEAQAIKRAHRIGQTKEVLVETIVLKGTIEEAIFERAKKMSRDEHLEAKTLEDDDKITNIIQNAKVIPADQEESRGYAQMARLQTPQQVFGRSGRAKFRAIGPEGDNSAAKPPKRQRKSIRGKVKEDAFVGLPEISHGQMEVDMPQGNAVLSSSLFGGP